MPSELRLRSIYHIHGAGRDSVKTVNVHHLLSNCWVILIPSCTHLTNILRRADEKAKCEFMENLSNIREVEEIFRNASEYKIDDGNIKSSEFNYSPLLMFYRIIIVITVGDKMAFLFTYKTVQAH